MSRHSILMLVFGLFAVGLPMWAMQANDYGGGNTNLCTGDCYQQWRQDTGGVVAIARAQAQAKATATPAELGKAAYAGCVACHGASGEGGVGPQLAGSSFDAVVQALSQYRSGETRGAQSVLMWSQAQALADIDIENLAAYIETF